MIKVILRGFCEEYLRGFKMSQSRITNFFGKRGVADLEDIQDNRGVADLVDIQDVPGSSTSEVAVGSADIEPFGAPLASLAPLA